MLVLEMLCSYFRVETCNFSNETFVKVVDLKGFHLHISVDRFSWIVSIIFVYLK